MGLLVTPLVVWLVWMYKRPIHLLVSSVILWRKLPDAETSSRTRWQWVLSMVCYVLVVVLLVLALAQPGIYLNQETPRHVIVLIDNSVSMSSFVSDTDKSRLSIVQEKIEDVLSRLNQSDTVSVVHLQGALNGLNKQSAVEYLKDIKFAKIGGNFDELIKQINSSIIAESKKKLLSLIICSDKMPPEEVLGLLSFKPLFILVGGPSNNKAIIKANDSPTPNKPGFVDIFAMVRNYSGLSAYFPAELYDNDGKIISSINVNIPAGGEYPIVFSDIPDKQKEYTIRINIRDELMADNEVRVWVGEKGLKICLIGAKNEAVLKALVAANGAGQVNYISYDQFVLISALDMDKYDLCIFNDIMPGVLPARSVIINPPDGKNFGRELQLLYDVSGLITPTNLAITDQTAPIFTCVNLDNIHVKSAKRLMINDRDHFKPLVKSMDDVIVGEFSKDGKYCLIIGFDVEWNKDSNWALMTSFPIFWANIVNKIKSEGLDIGAVYGEDESNNSGNSRNDLEQVFFGSQEKELVQKELGWYLMMMTCVVIVTAWILE